MHCQIRWQEKIHSADANCVDENRATLLDWIPAFPVTRDQLTMLAEGNTAPDHHLRALIDRDPLPFTPETLNYLCD